MHEINAQRVNCVNAESVNPRHHNLSMSKKATYPPSKFWERLDEALGQKWAPLNPNSVATRLTMSQGSVYRWYRGTGLPELETAIYLADAAGVSLDWLVRGTKPKYPIAKDPLLRELFEVCEDISRDGRERVLRAAKGELLQQQGELHSERERRSHGTK